MARRNPLRTLRGKMTLTYTAVTGAVFIVLWAALGAGIVATIRAPSGATGSDQIFGFITDDLAPFLTSDPIDAGSLQTYLDSVVSGNRVLMQSENGLLNASYNGVSYIAVVDLSDRVVAVEPVNQRLRLDDNLLSSEPDLAGSYQEAIAAQTSRFGIETIVNGSNAFFQVVPLMQGGQHLATFVMLADSDDAAESAVREVQNVFFGLSLFILLLSLVSGTLFGWLASRGLVRRLRNLETATAAWSVGDFEQKIADRSKDEVGQLARRLNAMAQQLDGLVETRTALATVEERNRLARDLHDTAKQQMFAASMQVSTAREIMGRDTAQADKMLANVEQLNDQIQSELSTLIRALRPAALTDQGLAEALKQLTEQWSQQNGISAELAVQGERELSIVVEQALYRVAQEALANVAKHARASRVTVVLSYLPKSVTLQLRDDGVGFSAETPQSGIGLHSMNERLAQLGGLVTIDSQLGRGTEITAIVES